MPESETTPVGPRTTHNDSLANALSGFGGTQDRTAYSTYLQTRMRTDQELTAVYTGGGLGRKIVSCRPDDMIRSWIQFPEDPDGKLLKALDQLNVRTHLKNLLTWTELYRGGIMVLGGLDNAQSVEEPLSKTANRPISFIRVYPASLCLNTQTDLVADYRSPYFEDIEQFRIQRRYAVDGAGEFRVHASRCIVSKGIPVPEDLYSSEEWKYLYWGMGRLQAVFDQMANSDTAQKAFANLIHEATVAIQKIPGLLSMLAGADDAGAALTSVMNNIARAKSVLNMILLDEGGEFSRDSLSMTGWRDAAMIFREELAAVCEIPVPRLYGIPSSGLGGGGSDEQASKDYNASIQADQEIKLRPIIQRLVSYIAPTVGLSPDIAFEFRPLSTPSEKEIAETRKIVMETDKGYVDMGALDAVDEVRESRFGGSKYSMETKLSADFDPEAGADTEIAALEAQLPAQKAAGAPGVPGTKPAKIPAPTMPKPKAAK